MAQIPENWKSVQFTITETAEKNAKKIPVKRPRNPDNSNTEEVPKPKKISTLHLNDPELVGKNEILESQMNSEIIKYANVEAKNCILENIKKIEQNAGKLSYMTKIVASNLASIMTKREKSIIHRGGDSDSVNFKSDTNNIHSVSKAYEDSYLRSAIGKDEKSCILGSECECMYIDPCLPFVGVEYKLPWTTETTRHDGMCLPCCRATTQILFFEIMHSNKVIDGLIQNFYNEHSKLGEYSLSSMLVCPPNGPVQNLPFPIVRHQRNCYLVYQQNKIHHMRQIGVDFC